MMHSTTNQPMRVSTNETSGPYILVPADRLEQVRTLFDANRVGFWVSHNMISIDGKPPVAFVHLRRGTNVQQVQTLLDTVA